MPCRQVRRKKRWKEKTTCTSYVSSKQARITWESASPVWVSEKILLTRKMSQFQHVQIDWCSVKLYDDTT